MKKIFRAFILFLFLSLPVFLSLNPVYAASTATCYDLTDTSAMLHENGIDTSQTFTDEDGKTWTAAGNAQIDTAQSKFSGASGLFDGAGDYISTPDHADFAFGAGNFTIDFWARMVTVTAIDKSFCSQSNTVPPTQDWQDMFSLTTDGVDASKIQIRVTVAGTDLINQSVAHGFSVDTWYHIALIRGWGGNANDFAVTKDGTAILTFTDTDAWPDFTNAFVNGWNPRSGNIYYNGWMDEFRVTKGVAIWTANFTPPASAYTECSVPSTLTTKQLRLGNALGLKMINLMER